MPTCSMCKENTMDSANFCHNCGYPLQASVLRRNRATLTTRYVTIAETAELDREPSVFPKDGFLVMKFGEEELSLPLNRRLILGREAVADNISHVDLTRFGAWEKGVSRNHATIKLIDGTALYVEDLASANGTFINGHSLNPLKPYPLQDGDQIHLAKLSFSIHFLASQGDSEASSGPASDNGAKPSSLGSDNATTQS